MSEANQKTIEAVYGAFGRGDVPFIVERTTETTHWDFAVATSDVPWHAPVHSRKDLAKFFQAVGENLAIEAFEPRAFLTGGREVAVKLRIAYTVKKTGKKVDEEQVHWWTFDDAGRIASMRHYEDTAAVQAAWRG
jgi:ketosteroid isomerase-like protein